MILHLEIKHLDLWNHLQLANPACSSIIGYTVWAVMQSRHAVHLPLTNDSCHVYFIHVFLFDPMGDQQLRSCGPSWETLNYTGSETGCGVCVIDKGGGCRSSAVSVAIICWNETQADWLALFLVSLSLHGDLGRRSFFDGVNRGQIHLERAQVHEL